MRSETRSCCGPTRFGRHDQYRFGVAAGRGPGAREQSVLMSVWRTCWQQGRSALDFLFVICPRSGYVNEGELHDISPDRCNERKPSFLKRATQTHFGTTSPPFKMRPAKPVRAELLATITAPNLFDERFVLMQLRCSTIPKHNSSNDRVSSVR
jgi:hypothetical protein